MKRATAIWTFVVASLGIFMVTLDNLVVTTALPVISRDLTASLEQLEWTVNAYTLTFAVLLLTGAALGDRFGRRRMFVVGLAVFTVGSAAAAMAPTIGWLVAARAFQGVGGAIVTPLTLTLLSAAVPADMRGIALGAWGGIAGLAVALGPVVGGAIVEGISWQWIFWINVPIGLVLIPIAWRMLAESYGPSTSLDVGGLVLGSTGLFGITWGLVRGNGQGWSSAEIIASLALGAMLLVSFVFHELRTPEPMLPMRLFRSRGFSAANVASMFMYFGMFGSVFLLAQFFQVVQGYSALQSGLRILPWTIMPIFIAPIAGAFSDRIGGKWIISVGLALQATGLAWLGLVTQANSPYSDFVGAFILSGIGMGLFFAPMANVVLSAVGIEEEGVASGANNAIREIGGVLGVAVLTSVFTSTGSYTDPIKYNHGLSVAVLVGAGVVAIGAVAAALIPRQGTRRDEVVGIGGLLALESSGSAGDGLADTVVAAPAFMSW
ncbi:MAG: DHA2 family efflux MFS transporter permease subunit [Thermoleophilia bacterium]|nr:DHA2 family efflux MFS transporter permease subunit [Thermoleophilia bacterium]